MALNIFGQQSFEPSETFLVGNFEGAQYPTIADAIAAATSVLRTEDNRAIIYVSPGKYNEDIFISDFISVIGVASGVHIAGSSNSTVPLVDVAQGAVVEKVTIAPTLVDKPAGLAIRDATMVIGGSISSPVNGTLKLNGDDPGAIETFTFTGEATTTAVVALINATAIDVYAEDRFGFLALASINDRLLVKGDGTANTQLGLLMVDVDKVRANNPTVYVTDISVIGEGTRVSVPNGKKITTGVIIEDRILGSVIINGIAVHGADGTANGVGILQKRGTSIINSAIIAEINDGGSGGRGLKLTDDPLTAGVTQVIVGTALTTDNGFDVEVEVNTKVLIMLVNSDITLTGAGVFVPFAGTQGFAVEPEWFLGDVSASLTQAITTLSEYARKKTISAEELFSPSVEGAADVEYGPEQRVKEFATGVDREVTGKRKHPETFTGIANTAVKLKATVSIDVSGGGGDVVRMVAEVASVPVSSDLVAPPVETITDDVDISTIVADEHFEVEFEFTSANSIPEPGDISLIKFQRNGAHGNDTYGNKLHLWALEWQY